MRKVLRLNQIFTQIASLLEIYLCDILKIKHLNSENLEDQGEVSTIQKDPLHRGSRGFLKKLL